MFLLVGVSVRALMESAGESGYPVQGIDFFADLDSCRWGKTMSLKNDFGLAPSVELLLEVAQNLPCEGLVYTSGPENYSAGLKFWEERGLLFGNKVDVLDQVRDPWKLKQALAEIGAVMPEFHLVKDWDPDTQGKIMLIKPLDGGGGRGVRVLPLPKEKDTAQGLISSLQEPARYIVQDYISGIPASVTFLADGQRTEVLGTSRQLTIRQGANNFIYAGNIVPLDTSLISGASGTLDVFEETLWRICSHLSTVFRLRGINTLDFVINSKGIWVLEVNPRWSASVELIEVWRGERLFARHLAACRASQRSLLLDRYEGRLNQNQNRPGFWGKRIVYAESSFQVGCGWELSYLYEQGVRDIPVAGTKIERGEPICTVLSTVAAASDAACLRKLQLKAGWVRRFLGDVKSSTFKSRKKQ
ncbi:MAG: ATP-grasp domain-containing protein [Desulfosporosinus sp.]|nr:ATP-grasp domain-containing protein [Desulfosporosinus sp.]